MTGKIYVNEFAIDPNRSYLSVAETSRRSGMTEYMVRKEIKLGRLIASQIGARRMVSEQALIDYLTLIQQPVDA